MLALPISTGVAGFVPSLVLMGVVWFFMTASGLVLGEVCSWFQHEEHIISMATRFLGPIGKWLSWLLYVFVAYASLVAYTAAGGIQLSEAVSFLDKGGASLVFILFFSAVIVLGNQFVGRANSLFFLGMCGSYLCLVGAISPNLEESYLTFARWKKFHLGAPLMLSAFSYQVMVPSVSLYLGHDAKRLRKSILGGTLLAFFIYIIWQAMVLGTLNSSQLQEAFETGMPINVYLRQCCNNSFIALFAELFAFFALVTSFLGISLGLFDFLADGLKKRKKGRDALLLIAIIALPVLYFALNFERVFLVAMDLSGGIGDSLLSGMIPVAMLWVGRYYKNREGLRFMPGGKFALAVIFLFYVATFFFEVASLTR